MTSKNQLSTSAGFVIAIFVMLCMAGSGRAQEFRANLTGQVTDPSGALVANATVTATNEVSKSKYNAKTNDKGVYYIPYVLPGTYTVTATAQGFKSVVQERVRLLASETLNQNFLLEVGSVEERVVVNAAPTELETATASGNTVIASRELENVPLNAGQSYTLIGTTPGSQFIANTSGSAGGVGAQLTTLRNSGFDTTSTYTIGGGIAGNNLFTLNGTNITSQYYYGNHQSGEWTVSPNIESIQEMNVMTTTYDARYGRTSGGTVNVVTKTGSDDFHGDARYAYQGAFMDANNFQNNLVGLPRQQYVQNQFWITAGGPIIKNKAFFFFGLEGYHQSVASTILENVPPAYLRPGYNGNPGVNFSLVQTLDPQEFPNGIQVYQPGTASCLDGGPVTACNTNHVVQTPFPGDAIPGSQVNNTAAAVLKYIPLPNIAGADNLAKGSNYLARIPQSLNYNQPQLRIDYNLNDKTKLYSYFLYWKGTAVQNQNGLSGIAANGSINHIKQNWVATQDVTHVFSPSFVGDFKVSFDRFGDANPDGNLSQQTDPSGIGLTMPLPGSSGGIYLPEFQVNDNWGTGIIANGGDRTIFGNLRNADLTNNYNISVDFTKTAGAHTLEFGGEIDEFQYGGFPNGGGNANGAFSFNSGWTQLNPHNANCFPVDPGSGNSNQCNSNTPNGSALASFYLGQPASGHVDWIYSILDGYPVYAGYFQDNWRVTHRLTLNLGFRYDIQRGTRERNNYLNRGLCLSCVNPLTNAPAYQANIGSSANQAAWNAAGINPALLQQVLGGIQFATPQNRDAYNTDWTDAAPRLGFAFALNPKTVIRGGYGIMYSYGLEGGNSSAETQYTNYTASLDGGNTPTANFQSGSPFSSGLLVPPRNSLGLLTSVGNGAVFTDFPQRRIPMEQVMSLGFQRELPGSVVLDARYAGNFTSRLRTFLWVGATASLSQVKAAEANPQIFSQQVPNPYYNVPGMSGPGQCGTSPTVTAITLLLPYSQYCSPGGGGPEIAEFDAPLGRNSYNGLEVKLTKRTTRGLTLNLAYTYSKTINGDGYENGWPYQDPNQIHWLAGTDRTHILSVTSVYDLPFGKGGRFLASSSRPLGYLVNGWTIGSVFNAQSGTPVQLDTGWYYTCPGTSFGPTGGTSVGRGQWFNNNPSCWQPIPSWGLMNLSGTTAQVRNPTIPNLDLSLQKVTPLTERVNLSLRLDAFNAFNSPLFGGPITNPGAGPPSFNARSGWSGFGTVPEQQINFPRILQLSGKISF